MVLKGSQWFSVVLLRVLSGSQLYLAVLRGPQGFSVVLSGSQLFLVVLRGSQWFSMVLSCF